MLDVLALPPKSTNKTVNQIGTCFHTVHNYSKTSNNVASYPGHMGGGKSGLVSTVCACANDSGNLPRTSPIMDKLHVVVMRRNNQTRYTACSVAAVFTRRWLPLSETQGVTRQGLRYNHRRCHRKSDPGLYRSGRIGSASGINPSDRIR